MVIRVRLTPAMPPRRRGNRGGFPNPWDVVSRKVSGWVADLVPPRRRRLVAPDCFSTTVCQDVMGGPATMVLGPRLIELRQPPVRAATRVSGPPGGISFRIPPATTTKHRYFLTRLSRRTRRRRVLLTVGQRAPLQALPSPSARRYCALTTPPFCVPASGACSSPPRAGFIAGLLTKDIRAVPPKVGRMRETRLWPIAALFRDCARGHNLKRVLLPEVLRLVLHRSGNLANCVDA